jgi:T5SS/PEP-CTERM-associated repeat protein
MSRSSITLACAALAVAQVATGQGLDRYWIEGDGGAFGDDLNWMDGIDLGVPGAEDTAIFDIGTLFGPVVFTTFRENHRLLVRSGLVTFDLASGAYTLLDTVPTSPPVVIGDAPNLAPHVTVSGGLMSGRFVEVGYAPGAFGGLTVEGGGAGVIANGQLHVGYEGFGTLDVTGGASVVSSIGVIALGSTAVGLGAIEGADSSWSTSSTLTVGKDGFGDLEIAGGATVSCGAAIVGQQVGAVGEARVAGAGSSWTIVGPLDIGFVGTGSVTVEDGAALSAMTFLTLGAGATGFPATEFGDGTLVIDGPGSSLELHGDLLVAPIGFGTLALARGGTAYVNGDVIVGTAAGFATIRIELADPGDPAEPILDVTGMTNDLPIDVALVDDFAPELGDEFYIARADLGLGAITYDLPSLTSPLAWRVDATSASSHLRVRLAGDVDEDGAVDVVDLLELLGQWGPCAACSADFDGDGDVDTDDLLVVLGGWTG